MNGILTAILLFATVFFYGSRGCFFQKTINNVLSGFVNYEDVQSVERGGVCSSEVAKMRRKAPAFRHGDISRARRICVSH